MMYGTVEGVFRSILDSSYLTFIAGDPSFPVGRYAAVEIPEDAKERAIMRSAVFVERR